MTVLPTKAAEHEPRTPGPVESAVLVQVALYPAAESRPAEVQALLQVGRDIDNGKLAVSHASLVRQLRAGLADLRDASTGRRGRLASVSAMSRRVAQDAG